MAGGRPVTLATARPAPVGVPAKAGLWARPGRPVVRLSTAAATTGAGAGTVLILTRPGTGATTWKVTAASVLTTADAATQIAAAPAGELVVLVPAGPDRWTVFFALPA